NAIDTAVRSSQARPSFGKELARGTVYVLRADLMTVQSRELIQSVAHIVLLALHGLVADQLARIVDASPRAKKTPNRAAQPLAPIQPHAVALPELEYFNGLGGFDHDGKEYVIRMQGGSSTPAPWINVVA